MNHTEILNRLAKEFGYRRYLEIGVQNPESNFNRITCSEKVGVDPDRAPEPVIYDGQFHQLTSNEFFRSFPFGEMSEGQRGQGFDLIFIDGLHTWEQCLVDIINAINVLKKGGTIVVHDLLPTSEEMQAVPRTAKIWTGDVWKAWVYIHECTFSSFQRKYIIDSDFGVGVMEVYHGPTLTQFCSDYGIIPLYNELSMDDYKSDYVIQPSDFKPLILNQKK